MDFSEIDIALIKVFASSYVCAKGIFGVDPIAASAKTQKRIRKWIEKSYIAGGSYPPEVMHCIGKEAGNEDFFAFLKACHDQIQSNEAHKKQIFDINSADFTEDVKSAIWVLLECNEYCRKFSMSGTDAQVLVDFSAGYERVLTLKNASGIPEEEYDCVSFENGSLIKQDGEYRLIGEVHNFKKDILTPFTICFTDARADITLFRVDQRPFDGTPWVHLQFIAKDIMDKYMISDRYLNDREKELLPLIAEISKLSYWTNIPDDFKSAGFSLLKSYIVKYEYNELLPLIDSLETEYYINPKKVFRIINKLISKLNAQKYEPLWRELHNILADTQSNYLSQADVHCPPELLNETRSNIQKLMESHGYSGIYPDFVKKGAIRGIRLADSYGMSYFIGAEKNVRYYIHCTEEYFDQHLTVQFLCGTESLRKTEAAGDIYSCLFNAKGRRIFQTVSYESDYINYDGELQTSDLEQMVQIAVKKAQLIKLTKEERKEICNFDIPYWRIFFLVFVPMGGLFGAFLTFGMMLLTVVICLLDAQPQTIPSMLVDTPWWVLFLLGWGLFGGVMGLITVLAKKK